jgi:ABC-type nitrate/sulfonate/bicarbonate transport system permease component
LSRLQFPRRSLQRTLAIVFVLGLWEVLSRSGLVEMTLFPPPSKVFLTMLEDLRSGLILHDAMASLGRVLVGFAAGSILGMLLGVATGLSETADATVGQILQLARPIPPIAIVPLVILWIGIGEPAKWFVVAFGVLFPVWINTHTGIRQIQTTYVWTARSMGARGFALVRTVYIPAAAPYLFAGLRMSLGIAFFCLVAAEMAGASEGLMYRVDLAQLTFRTDRMLEGIVLLGVLSACLDGVLMFSLRKLFPQVFIAETEGMADHAGRA